MRGVLQTGHACHGTLDNIQRLCDGVLLPLDSFLEVFMSRLHLIIRDGIPRVFLYAEFIEVDNRAHILDMFALFLAETAKTIELRKTEALCKSHKPVLDSFEFVWVLFVVATICSIDFPIKE